MGRFKRLRKSIGDRDWSTVFIELAILVVGVFFGIEAANWNEARQDRADERAFLAQLHVDILSAESLSSQIGDFRVARRAHMNSALDVLFSRTERPELTEEECQAVYTAQYVNVPFIAIGSFDELASSGRIDIIRDDQLRGALLRLQQAIAQSNRTVGTLSGLAFDIAIEFPELIRLETIVDTSGVRSEVRSKGICDTAGMRASQLFLNMAGSNIDLNDAFFRDAFDPWQIAIRDVRTRTEELLGISNSTDE